MRKEIDLSNATITKLQKLADKDGRKLKPYMERILVIHAAENEIPKPKRNGKP